MTWAIFAVATSLMQIQLVWGHGNHSHGPSTEPTRAASSTTSGMTCEGFVTTRSLPSVDPLKSVAYLEDLKSRLPHFARRSWRRATEKSIDRLLTLVRSNGAKLANQSGTHRLLTQRWLDALERADHILREHQRLNELDQKVFEPTVLALISSLTRLPEAWMTEEPDHLDVLRLRHILDLIVSFDEGRPRWSFFQIRRAIETRHSVSELANCR